MLLKILNIIYKNIYSSQKVFYLYDMTVIKKIIFTISFLVLIYKKNAF